MSELLGFLVFFAVVLLVTFVTAYIKANRPAPVPARIKRDEL
jgi:hypothetical protein